jgi:hypothetical protein
VLDYAGPFAGYWTPGLGRTAVTDWELEHAHFAERFQTFIIIRGPAEIDYQTDARGTPSPSPSRGECLS